MCHVKISSWWLKPTHFENMLVQLHLWNHHPVFLFFCDKWDGPLEARMNSSLVAGPVRPSKHPASFQTDTWRHHWSSIKKKTHLNSNKKINQLVVFHQPIWKKICFPQSWVHPPHSYWGGKPPPVKSPSASETSTWAHCGSRKWHDENPGVFGKKKKTFTKLPLVGSKSTVFFQASNKKSGKLFPATKKMVFSESFQFFNLRSSGKSLDAIRAGGRWPWPERLLFLFESKGTPPHPPPIFPSPRKWVFHYSGEKKHHCPVLRIQLKRKMDMFGLVVDSCWAFR